MITKLTVLKHRTQGQLCLSTDLEVELEDVLDVCPGREALVLPHEEAERVVAVDGGALGQKDGVVELQELVPAQFLQGKGIRVASMCPTDCPVYLPFISR